MGLTCDQEDPELALELGIRHGKKSGEGGMERKRDQSRKGQGTVGQSKWGDLACVP